jgi:crotonobetainyl-CoA:carnitine CoA-transferase CaiB-like acyl-CoA transferase
LLEGVRVVDLSTDVAGAYGAKLLASYGADVVKVEAAGGDPTRRLASIEAGNPDASVLFGYLNTAKRSVVLDAGDALQREAIVALLRTADVVIESGVPGEWAARGVDFDSLREERPGIVVCSVTPFGQTGPRAGWKATALTAFAAGGQMVLCGDPDKPPLKAAGYQAFYQAGLHVFSSTVTALFGAKRTGLGEWIDISIQEVQAASLEGFGPAAMLRGSDAERTGNQLRAIWGIYPCADGYIGVAAMSRQAPSVYECIGQPELARDPAFTSQLLGPENNEIASALIGEWAAARTALEVFEESARFRAPMALIPTPRDLLEWGPLRERGFWREVEHPVLGTHALPAGPFALDGDRGRAVRAPLLGEHTQEVLAELRDTPAPPARGSDGRAKPLLEGIRILDLTQVWAGPYATRFLGDMGADVIHIEGPRFPDAVRGITRASETRSYNRSSYFNEYNRNKRGLVLDLQHPDGLAAFLKMVERADVVMENWSNGVAEGLGLGYVALKAINPRVVMVQMPAFAQEGVESTRIGFGPSIEQMGGIVALQGYEGGPPHRSGISYGDPLGGTIAAGAVAMALLRRETSGEGCRVVVYQRDNVIGMVGEFMVAESIGHPLPVRTGNRDVDFAPHGAHRALDDAGRRQLDLAGNPATDYHERWVAIAVDSDEAWQALCLVVGDPRLGDQTWRTVDGRCGGEAAIDAIISDWVGGQDADAGAARLQAAGVAAAPVLSPMMLLADEHLREREFWQHVTQSEVGEHVTTHPVWRLANRPLGRMRGAPCFGEHNAEVLREVAGCSDEEISWLAENGVIADVPG